MKIIFAILLISTVAIADEFDDATSDIETSIGEGTSCHVVSQPTEGTITLEIICD